jgi:hypothetical protein
MNKQAMKKALRIAILISVIVLTTAFSSGCIKKEVSTNSGLDYSELVSTLDAGDKIDYRELVSIMFVVADDWNKGKSAPTMPIYKLTKEPGITAKFKNTTIRVIGPIEEGYFSFATERGVDIKWMDAKGYKKGERAVLIWDYTANDDVAELILKHGLLTEEEKKEVGKGDRTFFICGDTIIIAGKDHNLTKRAVAENFFPAVWLLGEDDARAVKANFEVALEAEAKGKAKIKDLDSGLTRVEMEEAVVLRNRAKLAYQDDKPDEALSLYNQSLSLGMDVPALCGKAQVLGSRSEGDLSCYVSKCPMCGSDVIGILSISKKEIVWSRHKPG